MPWLPPPTRPMTHTYTFTFGNKEEGFKTLDKIPIILHFCSHTQID
jgi:hypothetical protein